MINGNLLQGEKIRLTALTRQDLPALVRWYEDAGFHRLFDATPSVPRSEAQLERWLEERDKDEDGFVMAIRPLEGDALLGMVQIDGILWTHGNGWLTVGLGERKNWGQGFGREALELLLAFAFHELNLHRVQLTVFSYNERAIALYEKLGFTREGIFREHLSRDGRYHDMILYGLLRREWEAQRS